MRFRTGLLVLLLCGPPGSTSGYAQAFSERDVHYNNGSQSLAALLLLPSSDAPLPGVVIAQGSGTSDRTNQWARDIALALVSQGVAVLLTDKRGSGGSGGDWRTASFTDLAGDVLAGVAFLRSRQDIAPDRVGVIGLSQGGQVVPIAAARSDHIAFVINISGKAVGFAEGSMVEMGNTARGSGLTDANIREVITLNRAAVRYLTTGEWEPYARAREHARTTGARALAEGFPADPDAPIWTFLRSVVDFDPLFYWLQVRQPTLVVYGEDDEYNNTPVKESVRRLAHVFHSTYKTNYQILVVPGSGHGIRDPTTHRLAAKFLETLGVWLKQHAQPQEAALEDKRQVDPPLLMARPGAPRRRGALNGEVQYPQR